MSEKLCLQWHDFKENLNHAFGRLRGDKEFTDVTLACEDGQQVEAHKVILVASSPFFEKMFQKNKHPHPLIYLRGFRSEDMAAILDFIYFGEANVNQDNLDSFLAIAEELKLQGLTGSEESESEEPESSGTPTSHPSQIPCSASARRWSRWRWRGGAVPPAPKFELTFTRLPAEPKYYRR